MNIITMTHLCMTVNESSNGLFQYQSFGAHCKTKNGATFAPWYNSAYHKEHIIMYLIGF